MTHEELRELLGAYALDALAPGEREEVDAHLRTCARCRAEVADLTDVSDRLALLAIERDPPPSLRDRLLAIVEQDRAEWERARATAGSATGVVDRGTDAAGRRSAAADRETVARGQASGTWWRALIERMRRSPRLSLGAAGVAALALIVLGVLLFNRNNGTVLHTYACTAPQPLVDGKDFSSTTCALQVRRDRSITVAFNDLPPLRRTQAYELWLLPAAGSPVPVTGFEPRSAARFRGTYPHIDAARYAKAAVTIERAPGDSPAPRGPIVLVIPFDHPLKTQT